MRIGIYTLPHGWNYGGILQTYALSEVLKRYGHEPVLINRRKDEGIIKNTLKIIKWNILIPLYHKLNFKKRNKLVAVEEFKQTFLPYRTKLVFSTESTRKCCQAERLEAIIVGSDQIWRYSSAPDIKDSFLRFAPKDTIKIAYAASFAATEWEYPLETTEACKELLKDFKAVSLREISGVNNCKEHLGFEGNLALDPTLLAGQSIFDFSTHPKTINVDQSKGLLFTYILDKTDNKDRIVYNVSSNKGLTPFDIDAYNKPGVIEWIDGFKRADFIITDSFHGTCFAIIFNKPFLSIVNTKRGNARFETLAKLLEISDFIMSEEDDAIIRLKNDIDYKGINEKLEELRKSSLNALLSGLHGI